MPRQRPLEVRLSQAKKKLKRLDTESRIKKLQIQLRELRSR